jgi:putative zinc finger protein
MDHEEAVRQNATERYLLDELNPDQRERFEEHFFDCQDCAMDVRAAAMFVEHSKEILAEPPADAPVRKAVPVSPNYALFGWLRPALTVPVMALLLIVVGYQNLVQLPQLQSAANQPHVLPAISLNLLTYGSNSEPVAVAPGQAFLVNLIVPPEAGYSSYQVDLYNPSGQIDSSLPITGVSSGGTWPIQIPGANRQSGTYKLTVLGRTANGESKEVGRSSFELKIQK